MKARAEALRSSFLVVAPVKIRGLLKPAHLKGNRGGKGMHVTEVSGRTGRVFLGRSKHAISLADSGSEDVL
jgi:hypothetical protein